MNAYFNLKLVKQFIRLLIFLPHIISIIFLITFKKKMYNRTKSYFINKIRMVIILKTVIKYRYEFGKLSRYIRIMECSESKIIYTLCSSFLSVSTMWIMDVFNSTVIVPQTNIKRTSYFIQ